MSKKLKGFIISYNEHVKGVGKVGFTQYVERDQIKLSHENMVKENPDFEDSDSNCDDILRTHFLEQTLFYGDTLTDSEYDKHKHINCANLQAFKDKLFDDWLKSRVSDFEWNEINEE